MENRSGDNFSAVTAVNRKRCETVPVGWRPILSDLVDVFAGLECEPQIRTAHEKFGRLRVFLEDGSDAAYRLIEEAQGKALVTCDRCGSPGWLQSEFQGVIAVRCKSHAL